MSVLDEHITRGTFWLPDAKPCTKVEGCLEQIAWRPTGRGRPVCLEEWSVDPTFPVPEWAELYVVTAEKQAMRIEPGDTSYWSAPLFVCHTSRPDHRYLSKSGYDKRLKDRYAEESWRIFAVSAIDAAGYRCQRCHRGQDELVSLGLRLEVHHKHYDSLGRETFDDVEVLCSECHAEEPR